MNETRIYGELIWRLAKAEKFEIIEILIKRLKKEGKFYLLKNILIYLEEKYSQEKNIIKGSLKLAFADEIKPLVEFLEKKLEKKIEVEKVEIDEKLILGGMFLSKNCKIDFSLKNLFNKLTSSIELWKI